MYVIKFVSDLRQVSAFLQVLRFPPPIKLHDHHDITEILLKVTLNTITQYVSCTLNKKINLTQLCKYKKVKEQLLFCPSSCYIHRSGQSQLFF